MKEWRSVVGHREPVISPDLRTMRALNDFHQRGFQGEYSKKEKKKVGLWPVLEEEGQFRGRGRGWKVAEEAVDRSMVIRQWA